MKITAPMLTTILTCLIVSTPSLAADKSTTASTKPAKMSCEDFIALDDVVKPKVVYWAAGVNRKGKPEDAVVDIEKTDRLVPVLIEECTKTPKQSFWSKVKVEFKKLT